MGVESKVGLLIIKIRYLWKKTYANQYYKTTIFEIKLTRRPIVLCFLKIYGSLICPKKQRSIKKKDSLLRRGIR
jgi:hypothetical protein